MFFTSCKSLKIGKDRQICQGRQTEEMIET